MGGGRGCGSILVLIVHRMTFGMIGNTSEIRKLLETTKTLNSLERVQWSRHQKLWKSNFCRTTAITLVYPVILLTSAHPPGQAWSISYKHFSKLLRSLIWNAFNKFNLTPWQQIGTLVNATAPMKYSLNYSCTETYVAHWNENKRNGFFYKYWKPFDLVRGLVFFSVTWVSNMQ